VLYYVSMIWCWHLIWILVRTDHPCLGVGCHSKLPTTSLISKHAIPYRTCGGTCCPGVSTPKIQSLANLSITIHFTWRIPTVSTIPTHAQTTASNLTTVSHHDKWNTNTLNTKTSQTQHHQDGRLVWRLKTACLSNTTHQYKSSPKVWRHRLPINACEFCIR
jgi:hypothetical protein